MSDTPAAPRSALSDAQYHALTRSVLAHIESTADEWLQRDLIDIDTHRTGGLLELVFPGGSKIVINTQPPLHELWLAAKLGGYHFRWNGERWVDTRDGSEFFDLLSRQASAQAGKPLCFAPPPHPGI
jgi:CyaY protein